ncbi:ATP phosphoribosyltransferase [Brachyspira hyodysenteriae]|uniref:ATP phosphoribosyltransferase n=2 Tax=Brachyspira hyodysenteriae TaxID=159 RepID=HIS1_BRAHW|nr:ATP phosphoribosyltransferase [Brachyspira hyodysenteriae]C0QWY0.1 RecName: Full=ATP phosphoribosyltransferase; Short=ATP-PRT; Short=ATP-PRTase [Brachyspira hyodysenteriae WA1]ACN84783.1 ATP phosphoribosyltransferase catalytic subunit [Brachyspira hyodysenteriae WA1]ANN63152.1 ATP phosphoribosyltransferase [Brachyspira hyodysenteriae ATCC 27164]AUJ50511.1 ATP phosphoribosyltransferase [Brachyspira hyodysenteriae]KLI16045.1 ATP phosphoribosyltransferase [Brachyspira hyodysenteriae]KLI22074.
MINIALPKGRLVNKVYTLFEKIGYENKELLEDNRKLVFENKDKNVRYLIVKPSDVGIYVEKGVADIGIVGKDILLENNHDVYELLDLKFGKCRVCMASVNGYKEDIERRLRVATKYVNISKNYFNSINRDVEIIKLNGSIELAPILNLSDVIVDIVETGSTLRENNLTVIKEIIDYISARLIVNKVSYKFKNDLIKTIIKNIEEVL